MELRSDSLRLDSFFFISKWNKYDDITSPSQRFFSNFTILNSEFQKFSLFSEYGSTTGTGPVKEREHAAA